MELQTNIQYIGPFCHILPRLCCCCYTRKTYNDDFLIKYAIRRRNGFSGNYGLKTYQIKDTRIHIEQLNYRLRFVAGVENVDPYVVVECNVLWLFINQYLHWNRRTERLSIFIIQSRNSFSPQREMKHFQFLSFRFALWVCFALNFSNVIFIFQLTNRLLLLLLLS